ncbi:hypothetical protein HPB47_007521 [Ixodes persulcatus]|uniref:Uncharacterized protein n=1 Tax=Ixodes persulcatus TaxID=34615 RepID=A0AC60P763_IXOPE|nr:hypothetical protein HPB47_007521 [Ixodes persulcatus]
MSDIDALVEENQKLKDECKHLQKEVCDLRTVVDVYHDEDGVKLFIGLSNCALLVALLQYILGHYQPKHSRILPHAQQLLMALMKLRMALLNKDLPRRFRISCSSVSQISNSWIDILSTELQPCIFWQHMDEIRRRLPRLCKVPLFKGDSTAIYLYPSPHRWRRIFPEQTSCTFAAAHAGRALEVGSGHGLFAADLELDLLRSASAAAGSGQQAA